MDADRDLPTVVYVEDNPDNLRLVQRVLESTGRYRVLGAADGVAGLALIRHHRPAIVLLDLDLPILGGLELAKQIRTDPELAGTPVVVVSANVMHGERERCLDAGCMDFVEKPIDIVAFRGVVARCIRRGNPPT
ncbi:MAG: response regulator [Deltaproteobacteria bacterium]|nr:response regulator [Deltaproteobacteria bacterium]